MTTQQTRRALAPDLQKQAQPGSSARMRESIYTDTTRATRSADPTAQRIATGLGWFSIGLGLAEVLAPRRLSRLIGLADDHPVLLRLMGVREIVHGLGILSTPKPRVWVWSRVAGDALDLSLLCAAFFSPDSDKKRVALATTAVAGVTALDMYDAQKLSTRPGRHGGMAVVHAITVNRQPEEVFKFLRNFENLPRFMSHLQAVHVLDDRRSHWVAKAPAGAKVEWDAEIVDEIPNQLISWRSLEGSTVENYGTVQFKPAPGHRGTEVHVEIEYNPPGGALGAAVAKLFGEAPEQQIKGDLYRFKQVMEVGEVVHSDASIYRVPHPAQPPSS